MPKWVDLLNVVKQRVQSVPGVPSTIKVRKKLQWRQDDSVPSCIIAPAGGETIGLETMASDIEWRYPVAVMIVTTGDRDMEDLSLLTVREAIRNRLYVPTIGEMSRVFNADMDPRVVYEFAGQMNATYDVTGLVVTYSVLEARES